MANTYDQINSAYNKYLGRDASQGEFSQYWADRPDFEQGISSSGEAQSRASMLGQLAPSATQDDTRIKLDPSEKGPALEPSLSGDLVAKTASDTPYATTAGGVGVNQQQFNAGYEPGRTYADMPGFVTSRLNDPTDTSTKYIVARIIQDMGLPPTAESVQTISAELAKRGITAPANGDILGFTSGIPQDVVRDIGGPTAQWQFLNAPGAGASTTTTGSTTAGSTAQGGGTTLGGVTTPTTSSLPANYGTTTAGLTVNGNYPPELAQYFAALTNSVNTQQQQNAGINQTMRDALLRLLNQDSSAPSIEDPTIKPQADTYAYSRNRSAQNERAALAERFAFEGLNPGGQGSGAFDSSIQGGLENAGRDIAGYNAGLVGNEVQARRQNLMQALSLAQALGARTEAQQIQVQLAQLDAALRQEGLTQQNNQYYSGLGFNYDALQATLNREALLGALGG